LQIIAYLATTYVSHNCQLAN